MKKTDDTPWVRLCEYVKLEILEYDNEMKFPPYLALKLKGLGYGNYIANNNVEHQANYGYDVLLVAFKLNRRKIVDYLHRNDKKIKDEKHKINIIMKMIEPELNDIHLRMQQNSKVEERISTIDMGNQSNKNAGYTKKTKEVSDKLKDLF